MESSRKARRSSILKTRNSVGPEFFPADSGAVKNPPSTDDGRWGGTQNLTGALPLPKRVSFSHTMQVKEFERICSSASTTSSSTEESQMKTLDSINQTMCDMDMSIAVEEDDQLKENSGGQRDKTVVDPPLDISVFVPHEAETEDEIAGVEDEADRSKCVLAPEKVSSRSIIADYNQTKYDLDMSLAPPQIALGSETRDHRDKTFIFPADMSIYPNPVEATTPIEADREWKRTGSRRHTYSISKGADETFCTDSQFYTTKYNRTRVDVDMSIAVQEFPRDSRQDTCDRTAAYPVEMSIFVDPESDNNCHGIMEEEEVQNSSCFGTPSSIRGDDDRSSVLPSALSTHNKTKFDLDMSVAVPDHAHLEEDPDSAWTREKTVAYPADMSIYPYSGGGDNVMVAAMESVQALQVREIPPPQKPESSLANSETAAPRKGAGILEQPKSTVLPPQQRPEMYLDRPDPQLLRNPFGKTVAKKRTHAGTISTAPPASYGPFGMSKTPKRTVIPAPLQKNRITELVTASEGVQTSPMFGAPAPSLLKSTKDVSLNCSVERHIQKHCIDVSVMTSPMPDPQPGAVVVTSGAVKVDANTSAIMLPSPASDKSFNKETVTLQQVQVAASTSTSTSPLPPVDPSENEEELICNMTSCARNMSITSDESHDEEHGANEVNQIDETAYIQNTPTNASAKGELLLVTDDEEEPEAEVSHCEIAGTENQLALPESSRAMSNAASNSIAPILDNNSFSRRSNKTMDMKDLTHDNFAELEVTQQGSPELPIPLPSANRKLSASVFSQSVVIPKVPPCRKSKAAASVTISVNEKSFLSTTISASDSPCILIRKKIKLHLAQSPENVIAKCMLLQTILRDLALLPDEEWGAICGEEPFKQFFGETYIKAVTLRRDLYRNEATIFRQLLKKSI